MPVLQIEHLFLEIGTFCKRFLHGLLEGRRFDGFGFQREFGGNDLDVDDGRGQGILGNDVLESLLGLELRGLRHDEILAVRRKLGFGAGDVERSKRSDFELLLVVVVKLV